jgi:hypothetical protein
MVDQIAILIPTKGRQHRLERVVANALESTPAASVYLLMEPDEAFDVPGATTLTQDDGLGGYAQAINYGYRSTKEPLLFAGADDLNFWDGWATECRILLEKPDVAVVGTNDLGNSDVQRGEHATHYLVRRSYLDKPGGVYGEPRTFLSEAYDHGFTDREFTRTAILRGVFAPCLTANVEHMHPAWAKAPMDATYDRGYKSDDADRELYHERMAAVEEALS